MGGEGWVVMLELGKVMSVNGLWFMILNELRVMKLIIMILFFYIILLKLVRCRLNTFGSIPEARTYTCTTNRTASMS